MITIPKSIVDEIIKHAYEGLPNEACGLLTGTDGVALKHYALDNIDQSPEHFSFAPQDQFRVLKEARANGQKIVANYHSHPASPARPSEEDIRLAYDPKIVYIIVSLAAQEPVVKAFTSDGTGTMQPCEIQLV